ncbi:hypothetical protein V6N13_097788 [Hibiscus sabdariffa]
MWVDQQLNHQHLTQHHLWDEDQLKEFAHFDQNSSLALELHEPVDLEQQTHVDQLTLADQNSTPNPALELHAFVALEQHAFVDQLALLVLFHSHHHDHEKIDPL